MKARSLFNFDVAYVLLISAFAAMPLATAFFFGSEPAPWLVSGAPALLPLVFLGAINRLALHWSLAGLLFWIPLFLVFGLLLYAGYYMQFGLVRTENGDVFYPSFSDALYFSIVTFTTLGYGDLVPREEYRLLSAFQAIFGYVYFALAIGTMLMFLENVARFSRRSSS